MEKEDGSGDGNMVLKLKMDVRELRRLDVLKGPRGTGVLAPGLGDT